MSRERDRSGIRPYQGVFFDLYGTLLVYGDMDAAQRDFVAALDAGLRAKGWVGQRDAITANYYDLLQGRLPAPDVPGLTVFERRVKALIERLGLRLGTNDVRSICQPIVRAWQAHVELDAEVRPVLSRLSEDYALALVTNFDHPPHVRALLSELRLARFFRAIVISGEVGFKKPDPRIFAPALSTTGLRAEDVVYVGDTIDDVRGARAAGMAPIFVDRKGTAADVDAPVIAGLLELPDILDRRS